MLKIERIGETCILGEGPHWDALNQTLYFVDIFGKTIHKYNPSINKFTKASVGNKQVSFIIPIEGKKDHFVISQENDIVVANWDGQSEKIRIIENLVSLKPEPALKTHFNDGKCDISGRLWTGTLCAREGLSQEEVAVSNYIEEIPDKASFYSFGPNKKLKVHFGGVGISNGLAWSGDAKKLFYNDTLKNRIDQFDFDIKNAVLSNRRTLFSFEKHGIHGYPDGMTIDTAGNLWVAVCAGSCVIKVDSQKKEHLLYKIELPAKQVTSVNFGGPNMDELYVTTGSFTNNNEECPPPVNGALYKITGTGSKGFPGVPFKV